MTTTLPPEETPTVIRTVYPVTATLPDGSTKTQAKLVVTVERVYLFVGGAAAGGVVEAYQAPYTDRQLPPPTAARSDAYVLTVADGAVIAYREPGCGCAAAALKNYRPFGHTAARLGPTT